jgi:hypothetical protein
VLSGCALPKTWSGIVANVVGKGGLEINVVQFPTFLVLVSEFWSVFLVFLRLREKMLKQLYTLSAVRIPANIHLSQRNSILWIQMYVCRFSTEIRTFVETLHIHIPCQSLWFWHSLVIELKKIIIDITIFITF